MRLVSLLESGRRNFLEAAGGISPEHARAKPSPAAWSVLECIEHVVIVEDRFLGWIANGTTVTPERDDAKELRIFTMIRNRESKFEAPEVVRPQGRFTALADALAEFEAVRNRSIQTVQERGDALYAVSATHSRLGSMNGVELIHLIDGHARRHAEQIRETCEALAKTPDSQR